MRNIVAIRVSIIVKVIALSLSTFLVRGVTGLASTISSDLLRRIEGVPDLGRGYSLTTNSLQSSCLDITGAIEAQSFDFECKCECEFDCWLIDSIVDMPCVAVVQYLSINRILYTTDCKISPGIFKLSVCTLTSHNYNLLRKFIWNTSIIHP